ncbi:RNA-binding cell elongation regulator Jag/EloR [Alkalibacterium sp. MB6]|uniref:RNA-binding cell elongation regulator Jag/EloR n=1 Tax=Alkalibacterium sp. MB6 TaxID=2081965 RepID=UPI001F363306|nr:RNA-binding cell elongation regulator Jag/EloR [Alkalibacterium sp. MB6]
MMEKYTAQAPTTEEAIQKGLNALGIKTEEANIEVTQEAKKGFLGIGQKDAVVIVTRKESAESIEQFLATDSEPMSEPSKPDKTEADSDINEVEETDEDEFKSSNVTEEDVVTDSEEAKAARQEANDKDEKAIQKVRRYLETITSKMVDDDVTIEVTREDRRVLYTIETEDAGLIIGRHGKVLNSLQTLAQVQLHQEAANKLYAKVDAENYRDRRQKTVEQLATRTAEKVKRTNRPVILEPMPAHERKQIHRYLNQFKGVQTHSEGKEPHRYLVVEPSKEDQFTV